MDQLFIVLLGGKHPRASIEVHDICAAIGSDLKATYPQLRNQWFGRPEGLHIDAWMCVDGLDGYKVSFSQSSPHPEEPRLYLINLGGYIADEFGEAHRYVLVTAHSSAEAKHKGKQQALANWLKPHADATLDVDACIPIDAVNGCHIHLSKASHAPLHFENDYLLIES